MTNTASNKVLPLLRSATAALHKKLDESLPIASANPSIEDYSKHLLGFKTWLSEMESFIAGSGFSSEELLATNSLSLELLDRDLQALNISIPARGSVSKQSKQLSSAYCLGIEYVVKGSALGSSMLYSKVSELFPDASIEFMQDSKIHGKDRWKQFLAKLESYDWDDEAILSAQEGSKWAFQLYIKLHEMPSQHT